MYTLNHADTLKLLRTDDRVRQPKYMNHVLIKTARRRCKLQIYCYKTVNRIEFDFDGPDHITYEGGCLYMGPHAQRERNNILHELCHFMVADAEGKTKFVNYDSSDDDELATCLIEFWLGFMSGYYSTAHLIESMFSYSFLDGHGEYGPPTSRAALSSGDRYAWQALYLFLKQCRDQTDGNRLAKSIANELFVCSDALLKLKLETARLEVRNKSVAMSTSPMSDRSLNIQLTMIRK